MRAHHLFPAVLLLAGCGTDVAGPAASLFSCLLAEPVQLDVGEVVQVAGAANRGLCLEAGGAAAEFVYIPFHGDAKDAGPLRIEVSGAGVDAVDGPPSPSPVRPEPPLAVTLRGTPPRPPVLLDLEFHRRLRERERRELEPRLRTGATGSPAGDPDRFPAVRTTAVPEVGDLASYNVAISCDRSDDRTGRVEYVSDRAVVVADVANPAGLTEADYRHFGETFDTLVDPVAVRHFGQPTDIDENGRSIIFFTRAVNELAGTVVGAVTAGFFWSGDLFPEEATPRAEACPGGNQAEMFYMLTADPQGEVGPAYSVEFIREATIPVIGHEYQHLINASRRLWVNNASEFEEPWLNEGLSHVAEELLFYARSGLAPGANLGYDALAGTPSAVDAFNQFMGGNFTNYARYLGRPDTASLMGIDALPTRGATWNFLRYAADRSGRPDDEFFLQLVNGRTAGLENLGETLGADPLAWMRDWTVSVYADDAVPVDAAYRQASWNFRDLYPNSSVGRFPLRVIPLAAGDVETLLLQPGGAGFPRFGIGGADKAVLHVEAGGGAPPAALRGSFLRTR
ncbi:MAG TPA: hypothetical protein VMM12_14695 [Longimicrobiales bacterium]|nr:hypothetical protein [Longimicrobiales bacterium]